MSQIQQVHTWKLALTLYITLWSNDFELKITKDNIGSMWVMAMAIAAPTNN
jgi:hypothetical protein